jgi:hypothetical protein
VLELPPVPPAWSVALASADPGTGADASEALGVVIDVEVTALPEFERTTLVNRRPGERIVVDLPKERVAIVQATPRLVVSGRRPAFRGSAAAAVYPHDLDGPGTDVSGADRRGADVSGITLALTYRAGPPVEILLRAAAAGLDLERFNVRRFLDHSREVAGEMTWALDEAAIFAPLADGTFRETALRLRELHVVDLAMPEGTWLPEIATLQPEWRECGVPTGVYRFLRVGVGGAGGGLGAEPGSEFHVAVDEDGKIRTLLVGPE